MPTPYSTIAGQSVERLAALSDGVFAIAMTLLVLDLRVPAATALHGDLFRHVFVVLGPRFVPYLLSFMTLGIFWIAQQTQLNHFARSDRTLTWIQLGFLLGAALCVVNSYLSIGFLILLQLCSVFDLRVARKLLG